MPDWIRCFRANFYTFRRLYVANKKFRGGLEYLSFKWNDKNFNQFVRKRRITWVSPFEFPKGEWHEWFRLVSERMQNFFKSLREDQKIEFQNDVKKFLKKSHLSNEWFYNIAEFIVCRWIFPPISETGIRAKLSSRSWGLLEELEAFEEARYYPSSQEQLKNFREQKRIGRHPALMGNLEIALRANRHMQVYPVDKLKKVFRKTINAWGENERIKIPTKHIPNLKYQLTDEQVVKKLYSRLTPKQQRVKLSQLKKLRERLAKSS